MLAAAEPDSRVAVRAPQVNLEEGDKKNQVNQLNDDKFLMRHEFIEALLRIAGVAAPSRAPEPCSS